ncbi:hypothetical protein B0I35DRAFT_482881 [Stachybotrys elegans]|uniref:Zn(2)-C6 fungal-type domain-containing protein n=1 Tax=Stachybotrys elegans TaxID=80388 RepID=A0A8K0SH56_9HYPO|nr:hypothetical protein B0I35DRAFT_482881 [Stachybotrys elegans]
MPISRKKSCVRCRAAKARCGLEMPACSRCIVKGVQCQYETFPRRHAPYPNADLPWAAARDVSLTQDFFGDAPAASSTALAYGSLPLTDLSAHALDLDMGELDRVVELTNETPDNYSLNINLLSSIPSPDPLQLDKGPAVLSIPQNLPSPATHMGSETSSLVHDIVSSGVRDSLGHDTTSPRDRDASHTALTHKGPKGTRILKCRTILKSCILTSVVLGQLTGYPKMLIEGDRPPPFIVAPCYIDQELVPACAAAGRHVCLSKILAVCGSLVQMFHARNSANSDFVWITIYNECRRLQKEFPRFSADEQLAAFQSLTIFTLMQAGDMETVEKNDAGFLLTTAMEMMMHLTSTHDWRQDPSKPRPGRRDWSFGESITRLLAIYCIVDLLLDGMRGPNGKTCEPGQAFNVLPLPCTRDVWEARTTSAWIAQYDRYRSARTTNDVLTPINLTETSQLSCTASVNEALGTCNPDVLKWCENLDALGSLIWMVMPLHHYRQQKSLTEVW